MSLGSSCVRSFLPNEGYASRPVLPETPVHNQ
uniref:Uncharacterized protein n=1 Tax=Siphoviridae sp. ctTPJ4 TaxID=2825519 RepID=A0A8S5V0B7_9CAUD|nr:MAG TPA: hypothetical protein [Siphoviridae sp. ctTPJ4]